MTGEPVVSEAQWYYMTRGERTGPISQAELMSRAQSGLLSRDELVWRDGFTKWVSAGTIKGLFLAPPPAPSAKARLTWWQRLFHAQTSPVNAERTAVRPQANRKQTKRDSKIDRAANRKMIAQLRDDAVDTQLVAAETIRVSVRLNPVNIQIHNFIGSSNQSRRIPRVTRSRKSSNRRCSQSISQTQCRSWMKHSTLLQRWAQN